MRALGRVAPALATGVVLIATLPTVPPAVAGATQPGDRAGRLLVKVAHGTLPARATLLQASPDLRPDAVERLGGCWLLLRGADAETRARVAAGPSVLHVERDHRRRVFGDPAYRRYQPYLRASMDVDDAWRHASGRGVTVAVIDSGVDPHHEDLPRVLRGRDFVDGDRRASDPLGHGTFVAGVVAAERDNRRGIAGVSRAAVLPVRVVNSRGWGRDSDIAAGIRWAARQDADIINLSLGGPRAGALMRDAVRFAVRQGSLVVAAAGNSGGARPMYPAAYPEVLAVGSTDTSDRLADFSQHGAWLDLVAPGVRIASTVPGDRYALGDGTSFSAPLVAGAAALAAGRHPRWSAQRLRSALVLSAADAGPVGPDPFTGYGVIDVDGLVGGGAKQAVASTGPSRGTTPGSARPLDRGSEVRGTPEGTATWFRLPVDSPTRVAVGAGLSTARRGVLRGDVELTLYDAALRPIETSDRRSGAGRERVSAVVGDDVYVRVSNTAPTRWPGTVGMSLSRDPASAGAVVTGTGRRPTLLASTPAPESYGHPRADPLTLVLGFSVQASSVSPRTVQLVDGHTGQTVARRVTVAGDTLVVTPAASLATRSDYAVVLDGLRRSSGTRVAAVVRVGFRTGD